MGVDVSAGMLDFSNISPWAPSRGVPQIAIAPKSDYDQPTATLGRESSYGNRVYTVLKIIDLARKNPTVQPLALARLVSWVSTLPEGLPDPFVAIADDGSISSEWDIGGSSLHVTFIDDTDEVYFFSPNGDEWESTLDAVDKISGAMRVIALSSRR